MNHTGKTRKRISLLLACAMLAALLSGCYEGVDTTIRADGSGTITVRYGATAEELETLSDGDGEYTAFEVDGVTYYGTVEELEFASAEEFNEMFSGQGILLEAEDGGLTLTLDNRSQEDEDDGWVYEEFKWTEERIAVRKEQYLDCFRAKATGGFKDADLREAAEHLARTSSSYSDGEFAEMIEYWRDSATVEWLNSYIWDTLDDIRNYPEYVRYPLTEDQRAERRAAIEALLDQRGNGLSEEDRAFYTECMCDWYDESYNDAEFAEAMRGLRTASEKGLRDWLDHLDENYRRPLTEDQRAERRAAIGALLDGLTIGLSEEDKAFYTESMSDWYDEYFTDAEFAEVMAQLRAMGEEELREELDWFDYYYDKPTGASDDLYTGMVMSWIIRFDAPVTQLAGPADGVSIEDGTLTLDLNALAEELYRFTTRTDMGMAYEHGQAVEVDGVPVTLSCYAVRTGGNETNYVRIRELAEALRGTPAQFDVSWDGAVEIRSGAAYSGGAVEAVPFSGRHPYTAGGFATGIDGSPAELDAITLNDADGNGYTYYKLRDLGLALGFNVRWDAARKTVCIETDKPYSAED